MKKKQEGMKDRLVGALQAKLNIKKEEELKLKYLEETNMSL